MRRVQAHTAASGCSISIVGLKRCGLCCTYVRGHPTTHCPPPPHFPADFHLLSLQEFLHHLIPRSRCHADLGRIPTRGCSQGACVALCAHPVPSAFSDRSHVNATLTADSPVLQLPVLYVVRSSLLPIHATHSFDRLATPFPRQIVVYAVVIFAVWNIPAVRNVINPLKLFTIGWHELCHIIAVSGLHPSVHCQDPPVRSSTRLRLL